MTWNEFDKAAEKEIIISFYKTFNRSIKNVLSKSAYTRKVCTVVAISLVAFLNINSDNKWTQSGLFNYHFKDVIL